MKRATLRKQPVQQRSADRLARILEAAAQVFEDRGFEGATTEAIAARAGVSIGSLYQYFPGKAAVFRALADQFLVRIRSVFDSVVAPELASLSLEQLVGQVVDTYAAMHRTLPGFRALMSQGPFSPEIVAATKELFSEFELRIAELLRLRNPALPAAERLRISAVCVHVFHILSVLALRGDAAFGAQGELVTEEMKRVLLSYLREREPPPKKQREAPRPAPRASPSRRTRR